MSKIKPKFKVGDILTVFDMNKCTSALNKPNKYYFGGQNQFGKPGKVIKVYNSTNIGKLCKKECYKLEVQFSGTGYEYSMLEDEFEEYYKDSPKIISEQDLCDLLPENWYTNKTEEILNIFKNIFKDHPYYSTILTEIEDYVDDPDYPFVGYNANYKSDMININREDYFEYIGSKYISSEKILELFSTTSLVSIPDPILESVVTYETQSETFVESNISQITETREQPKSFFNF